MCPTGKSVREFGSLHKVHPRSQKFSAFAVGQITFRALRVSRPIEGRFAIVMIRWARDAMDVLVRETSASETDGEVVWS
jgi:hypothetical protein